MTDRTRSGRGRRRTETMQKVTLNNGVEMPILGLER
jgi:hypothetical protein